MKKVLSLILFVVLFTGFVACNEVSQQSPPEKSIPTNPSDPTDPDPTDPNPTNPTDPKPTDPTDPNPTDPTDPDPTNPTQPIDPIESNKERTVLICDGCKTDVLGIIMIGELKEADWSSLFFNSKGIANWIIGKEAIPFSEKPTCESMNELLTQSLYVANFYRNYHLALKNGASATKVAENSLSTFSPDSKEHNELETYLYNASNLSFSSAQKILEPMQKADCLKGESK